jgi:hypothetical protein
MVKPQADVPISLWLFAFPAPDKGRFLCCASFRIGCGVIPVRLTKRNSRALNSALSSAQVNQAKIFGTQRFEIRAPLFTRSPGGLGFVQSRPSNINEHRHSKEPKK